jgi:hypothetical protein
MRKTITAICTVLILLASGKAARACSCTVHPVCDPHRYLDADFIGEVISIERVERQPTDDRPGFLARTRVIEKLRGTPKIGEIVKVFTGTGGGDCGYKFEIGAKYLFDAFGKDGIFETHTCTLTVPIEQAEVELRALRTIARGQKLPDLTGILSKNTGLTPENFEEKPFPGIRVSLLPVIGGPALESTTDSFGAFIFPTLASGRYSVRLDLPGNFSLAWSNFSAYLHDDQLPLLVIEKSEEVLSVCHIEIFAETSGSISGIIQVPGNKFADWLVEVDSVDANGEPVNTLLQTDPNSMGIFRLSHLPAGRYAVICSKKGAFVESVPQIVDLKDGEQKTGVVLKIK